MWFNLRLVLHLIGNIKIDVVQAFLLHSRKQKMQDEIDVFFIDWQFFNLFLQQIGENFIEENNFYKFSPE